VASQNPKFRRGAKVTIPHLQIHSAIKDTHTSHIVERPDGTRIWVGDGEEVDGGYSEPIETHTSYLITNQWDGTDAWVTEDALVGGHDFTLKAV
jgi:hypothetical protein